MSKSRRALVEIVGYLSNQLTRGWADLQVAQQIDDARRAEQFGSARSFFEVTYDACVESAILTLARLMIAHKDSINVDYLLNCVQQSPSAFPIPARAEIMDTVERHRTLLQGIQPLVNRVKDYRDRTIAHLDKKHVNQNGLMMAQAPIALGEIERAFERTLVVLDAYQGYLGRSTLQLASLKSSILKDWTYLLNLIEQDNGRP